MKKLYIVGLFLGLTLAVSPIRAETVLTPQEQYNQALMQLITLLQAQVAELVTQLQTQLAQQTILTTKIDTIVQNTTPVVTPTPSPTPTFGSVVSPSINSIDLSAMTVSLIATSSPRSNAPYGTFSFKIIVLDKNGKNVKDATVNWNVTDNRYTDQDSMVKKTSNSSGITLDNYWAEFWYIPTTSGSKTITFTSGNLSTSTTIEVK